MSKIVTTSEAETVTLQDAEFCIKTEEDIINVKYHNICTGEVTVVPTGAYTYFFGIPAVIIVACITVFALTALVRYISE